MIDRDRVYELNREDSRTLAAIGTFRVVPERHLGGGRDPDHDTLDHLHDQGLIRTIALGDDDQAVVLTAEGRDLLDANRRERDEGVSQEFHAGVNRPRELDHDAQLYNALSQRLANSGRANYSGNHRGPAGLNIVGPAVLDQLLPAVVKLNRRVLPADDIDGMIRRFCWPSRDYSAGRGVTLFSEAQP